MNDPILPFVNRFAEHFYFGQPAADADKPLILAFAVIAALPVIIAALRRQRRLLLQLAAALWLLVGFVGGCLVLLDFNEQYQQCQSVPGVATFSFENEMRTRNMIIALCRDRVIGGDWGPWK